MTTRESELHLFILWEHARSKQKEIVTDLVKRMHVVDVFSISWSEEHFSRNLSRFYGQKLPAHSAKERQCGRGAFLVILVRDDTPRYELRKTTAGSAVVNVNMFDAKQEYRNLTGGGHRVHGTNSTQETSHDLVLLLGAEYSPNKYQRWDGSVTERSTNVPGATGWQSLRELLAVFNKAIPYVVLRNFEEFPDTIRLDGHTDIDFLVSNCKEAALIANAERVFWLPYRVQYTISITGERIPVDFREVGDGYFDENWQSAVLWSRAYHPGGFYIPEPLQYFYTLLYHALVHKNAFAEEYRLRLQAMAADLDSVSLADLATPERARSCLQKYLDSQEYGFTDPSDLSVIFNPPPQALVQYSFMRKLKNIRRAIVRPIGKLLKR